VLLESLSTSSIILDLKKQDMDLKRGVVYESIIPPDNKIELDVFNKLFTTCRLNYAACQLKLKNYTSVIEQCSMVLNTEPENQKALFRRGQAYIQHGMHLDLAERDLSCLQSFLDEQSVEYGECQKWKKVLQQKMEVYRAKERKMYGSMFS
jgi:tetratricopeptide (TPR) repeat protein